MKRWIGVLAATFLMTANAYAVNQTYSTDWVGNTYGTNTGHVGNAARSMWVDPTGLVYTASMWDENEGGIAMYQNGTNAGSIGAHGEPQGSTITGNATYIWAPRQFDSHTTPGNGWVYRYNRATKASDQQFLVSADGTERHADIITGSANWGQFLAFSDHPGNRLWFGKTDGTLIAYLPVTDPGALAFDRNGNIWVAQESTGAVLQFNQTGTQIGSIQLAGGVPHSLYFEPSTQYLWIGDAGPDENIKVYDIHSAPVLAKTFGTTGGYLDSTTGIRGQVGSLRFARIDGIGKDAAGNLYVLSQPWGGSWDNGRTGGTDLYAYSPTGTLLYNLRALNFEGIGMPDPSTDATAFYSGTNIYSGTGGANWNFVANTVDPFTYPADMRLNNTTYPGRGMHFGMVATVGQNRILVATDQNPDGFFFYHFNGDYIAVPDGSLGGTLFGNANRVRHGFCLASNGDVWAGMDKSTVITHWPLTGFDANGVPSWGAPVTYATPATIGTLGRVIYLPESDTLILANIIGTDWTSIGTRVEVYHGWIAGNQTNPVAINLTSTNPKSIAAAGNYLFVGYVHTVPNVDAFNLTTGTLDNTFIDSNPSSVYVGNDVDSMYGIRAVLRANGEYVVTKDDYNGTSLVLYRWVP